MPKGFLSSTGRMSMISLDGMEISCPDRLQGSETEGSRFVCKTMVCTLKVVSSHLMRLRYCKSLYLFPALIPVVYKNQHRRPEPCFQVDQSSNIQEPGAGSLLRSCDGCPWPLLRWPTQLNPVRSKRSAVIQTFHSKFILQNDTDPVRKNGCGPSWNFYAHGSIQHIEEMQNLLVALARKWAMGHCLRAYSVRSQPIARNHSSGIEEVANIVIFFPIGCSGCRERVPLRLARVRDSRVEIRRL